MPRAETPPSGLVDTWGRRNRKIADRECAQCGTVFRPVRHSAAYCSRGCARKKNGGHNIKPETWWINGRGYIEGRVLTAQGHRRIKLHRFIMEKRLGRRLRADEDVHHKDGNKANNALENLELLSHGEHSREHNSSRVYRRGYKLSLSDDERLRRAERMKSRHAALSKARPTEGAE